MAVKMQISAMLSLEEFLRFSDLSSMYRKTIFLGQFLLSFLFDAALFLISFFSPFNYLQSIDDPIAPYEPEGPHQSVRTEETF